jgi:hypothetical protein
MLQQLLKSYTFEKIKMKEYRFIRTLTYKSILQA